MSARGITTVVMLTNAVSPDKLGGLERYVRELAAAMVRRGVPTTVITKRVHPHDLNQTLGQDGVRIVRHRVPSKRNPLFPLLYPLWVSAAVRRELRRAPGALIHGHYAITTLPAALGTRPYLYTFHAPVHKEILSERQASYWLPRPTQSAAVAALRLAERRVARKAKASVTLSAFMQDELRQLVAPEQPTTRIVPGGIDTNWFTPGMRKSLWPDTAPLLFCARRLTRRTGVRELIAAMPSILSQYPRAALVIAGDGGERDSIEADIRRLSITGSVRLVGRVSDEMLRDWYRAADVSVTPTQELEGFGLSTGESLACGTPALVTPVGANAELVAALSPKLVCRGTASEDIAAGILSLLSRPDELEEIRRHARACAHPAWSWDTVAGTYLQMYEAMTT